MKKFFLISPVLFLGFICVVNAQKSNEGVYLSANDFTIGKISYGPAGTGGKYALHVNEFSFRAPVKIITGNQVIRLDKDSVYGFRDRKNVCYRFYKNGVLQILNPTEKILIYTTTALEGSPRDYHRTTKYWFSENPGSQVYPLTKWNLKMVLNKDILFHQLLDVYFQDDDELTAYDRSDKIYLLNRVYEESKQSLTRLNRN